MTVRVTIYLNYCKIQSYIIFLLLAGGGEADSLTVYKWYNKEEEREGNTGCMYMYLVYLDFSKS